MEIEGDHHADWNTLNLKEIEHAYPWSRAGVTAQLLAAMALLTIALVVSTM
jgi:hypothetical protein